MLSEEEQNQLIDTVNQVINRETDEARGIHPGIMAFRITDHTIVIRLNPSHLNLEPED